MRTSGAGKGGVLAAVAGVVAIGVAGCGSGSDAAKQTDAVGHVGAEVGTNSPAAAGSTSSNSTGSTGSTGSAGSAVGAAATSPSSLPTSATSSTSVTSPTSASSTGSARGAIPAPATSTAGGSSTAVGNAAISPNQTDAAAPPYRTFTPKPGSPTPKPPPPAPKPPTGSGWLAGVPHGSNTPGPLDPRCMTGRVICVDMSTRTLLWVVDGKPQYGMDVRFGDENNPTRKGKFSLYMKMKDCISTIYHTPMPDAMFFSGGEAVHFSIDFKTYGYAHHSHGCVNVRDRAAVDRLFADTRVGDTVVVY